MTPRRDERGTAIVEMCWLGLLLLVPLVYVLVAVFDAQRTTYAAAEAARSASRAFVTAPDQVTAYSRARTAARLAFDDQGLSGTPMQLQIRCDPAPAACLTPGSVVTVTVSSAARLPLAPSALGAAAPRVSVRSVHSEPYGEFREARP